MAVRAGSTVARPPGGRRRPRSETTIPARHARLCAFRPSPSVRRMERRQPGLYVCIPSAWSGKVEVGFFPEGSWPLAGEARQSARRAAIAAPTEGIMADEKSRVELEAAV